MSGVYTEPEDARLVSDFLKARDEGSFLRLYRRHTPFLMALSRRLLQTSAAEVEDAVQETWIRATTRLPAFRWESSLRTWLAGIAFNCCREQRRRAAHRREDGPPQELELKTPMARSERLDVERAISALPRDLRDVVVLHTLAGHTHEEIATLLGIAPGTSKSRLFEARRQLRARLGRTPSGRGVS
jgi:RNA polymerase sigma-70 factor (ECF subfamily)